MHSELSIIVFKDDEIFIAQCLEIDIASQGATAEEAVGRLKQVYLSELREAEEREGSIFDIGPAPSAFHALNESTVIERSALVA